MLQVEAIPAKHIENKLAVEFLKNLSFLSLIAAIAVR
jgi:hypothetical protein